MTIAACIDYLQIEPFTTIKYPDAIYAVVKANGGIYYCTKTDKVYILEDLERMLNQGALRYLILQFDLYRALVRKNGVELVANKISSSYFRSMQLDNLLDRIVLKYYGHQFSKRDMLNAIKTIMYLAYEQNSQQLRTEFKHNDLPIWCFEFGDYVAKMLLHLFFYIPRKYAILNYKGD